MKRAVVAALGGVLTLAGIALLVLPGPGFVLVAAGLAVLATQFSWARKPLDYAKDRARQGVDEVATSRPRAVLAVVCALALIVVGGLGIADIEIPLVNTVSAILLIASGLFLIGTVLYARRRGATQTGRRRTGADSDA